MNANIQCVVGKAEDPQKLVRLMIQEMERYAGGGSLESRVLLAEKQLSRRIERATTPADRVARKAGLICAKIPKDDPGARRID